jgi:hypothetical protein
MVRKGMMIKANDSQPEMAGCASMDAPRAIGSGMHGGAMPEMSAIIGMGKDGKKYYIDPSAFTTQARAPVPRTTQLTGMAKPLLGMTQKMEGGFLGSLMSMALPLIGSLFGKGMMTKEAKTALTKHFSKKVPKGQMEGGFLGSLMSMALPLIGSLFGKGMMTKEAHDELVKMCKKGEGKVTGGALGVDGDVGRPMRGSNETYGVTPEVERATEKPLSGGSFWGGFMDSYADAMGEGRATGGAMCGCEGEGVTGGKKRGRPTKPKSDKPDGRKARAEIVKKVMRERGIKSLAEASKIVKSEGLY